MWEILAVSSSLRKISVRKDSAGLRTMLSPPRNPIYPVTPSCGITPCARGCAVISGKSRIGGEAIIEDHAIVTSGYVHGNVHISGNAKIFANAVTGGTPVIMEKASVYGELGGEIEVHEHAVILPGVVIDNPTIDVLHIRPDEIVVERKFKRESPVITPPPEYQPHPRASKKRSRGEER